MSAITRLSVETELIDRCAGLLTLVGKPTAATGSNAALTGPIGFGAVHLNVGAATPGVIIDSDLTALDPTLFYTLCDLAEYRLIASCLSNYTEPDQTVSMEGQQLNAMMLRFQARLSELAKQYAGLLNVRRSPTLVGCLPYCHPTPNTRDFGIGYGRIDH